MNFKEEFKIYRSLTTYINDNTLVKPLSFSKMYPIFTCYLTILFSFLILYFLHFLIHFTADFIDLFHLNYAAKELIKIYLIPLAIKAINFESAS